MALNKEALALNIATDINTNTAGEVTAQDVRENLLDVVDSIFDVPGDSGRTYSQTVVQGSSTDGAVLWSGDLLLSSGTLEIEAGTTSRAPIKLNSGTNLTSPQAGAIEFDGTNLYVTQTSGPTRQTLVYSASPTITTSLNLTYVDDGVNGPSFNLYHNSASPANNDEIAFVNFDANNSIGTKKTFGKIREIVTSTSNAAENSKLVISAMNAGTLTDVLTINPTSTVFSTTTTAGGEVQHWIVNSNGNGYSAMYIYCGTQYYRNVQCGQSISPSGRYLAGSAHFETGGTGGFTYTIGTTAGVNNCFRWYISNQSVPVMVVDSSGGGNIQLGKTGTTASANGLSNAMVARVNLIQNTVDTKIERLQTEQSSGDHVIVDTIQQKILTTNNTTQYTTIQATANDYSYIVESTVLGRRTSGGGSAGDTAGYKLFALFKNVSGTLTQVGTTDKTVIGESDAGCDATLDANSTNIRVGVTGITGVNYTWHITSIIKFLST